MIRPLSCCLVALLAGCSGPASREPTPAGTEGSNLQAAVAEDMTAIRLKVAEGRIVALEKQVDELKNTPEKVDLQLLTQRIEQVEARVYAKSDTPEPVAATRREEPALPSSPPLPAAKRFNPFGL